VNTSPKITRKLYNALAALILTNRTREQIRWGYPKGFDQAVAALSEADPEFVERLAETQQALAKSEEEARLRMGGYYIKIDGTPLCCCPTAKIANLSKRSVYAPCWQRELSATVEAVEAIREMNPDCKVTYHAGGCPREE